MSGRKTASGRRKLLKLPADPCESARVAGLRYVTDEGPGIARKRAGSGFSYIGPDGRTVRDAETLQRIRSLVIPPAWTSVWICASPNGHLQAVGRDARGRKQYRYHPLYRAVRDETKYSRMAAFALALPRMRQKIQADLQRQGMPREKVLAAVVRLLETTCIRVGNEEYAKTNDSYGLTTMQEHHVDVNGTKVRFHFRGKSGLEHDVELSDRRLSRIIYDCQVIPGEELFHYIDSEGSVCKINSEDVNDYLREISGEQFSAKDFRTWVGSTQAALELEQAGPASSETEVKKNVAAAIKNVASKLGNKPSTCRKYYVHPAVLESYSSGTLFEAMQKARNSGDNGLRSEEKCLAGLIETYAPCLTPASPAAAA